MGLELVELVLAVEDTYGLKLADKDAQTLDTAGKLYDYILTHRFQGVQDGCLSSIAFHKLRRALISILHVSREDVRVCTRVRTLIPTRRRQAWRRLQQDLGLRLPRLRRPAWATSIAALAALGSALFLGVWFASVLAGLAVFGALGYLLFRATEPLAVELPPECATVRQLVKTIVAKNFGAISDQCGRANAEELWESLRTLISDCLGVPREQVTRQSHFVKDLGAG